MSSWRGGLAAMLFLLLAAVQPPTAAAPDAPRAVAGRLELPHPRAGVVSLDGQWGFAWQEFVAPDWERLPATAFAPVPASWNKVTADAKPPGEDGWGTYLLLVDCPRGQSLAVEAMGQRTASRLFVNGVPVAAHGEPGPSPAQSWAAVHNRVPITREFPCPLRLTLHISNFDHRAGGFVRPMTAGPVDALQRQREGRVIYDTALLGAYLLTAVAGLLFFALRRREKVPLAFALFCIAIALYTDMIGERLLLRFLPPQVDWRGYMRAEYLSWLAAMALFVVTLRGLFPAEIHRRLVHGVLALVGVAGVAVLVLPPAVYSYLVLPGQSIAVLVGMYLASAMLRARRRAPVEARVLLAGMVAIVLALVLDLVLIDVPGPDRKFVPIGFALFLLSPAVVIARRMTHALNAEERARTLEENARLRDDVERMSRHDMKTPLNSILGASRLLADDPSLASDQRELAGVLQRAGLRLLEMVNLSLGLFRIETGTYALRPQALDLLKLVDRVLVDLHAHAEARGVKLHLRSSARAHAVVRGEELLCYSIVANLVKNAIEAAAPGQQVTVGVERADPVALTVHNPGEVPPAIAARFFDKYVTGGKSGGTGLGTYSARLMARTQGGDLQLRTGAGGTTLVLTLPAAREQAPSTMPGMLPQAARIDWAAEFPARRVVLADDDEYTRLVTRRYLPSPPFRVETAANGKAATQAMARDWPDYLVIDMEMPVLNGLQAIAWVRSQEVEHGRPRCRIVMVSGNDDEAVVARALGTGADRFLSKPVARERLLAALYELETGLAAPTDLAALAGPPHPDAGSQEVVRIDAEWIPQVPDFLRNWRESFDAMARALAAGNRREVQFLAHRVSGGLGTLGLHWAAQQGRSLEAEALQAAPADLQHRIAAVQRYLAAVRIEAAD